MTLIHPPAQMREATTPPEHPAQPFVDPLRTLDGPLRPSVRLRAPETLWFNTGKLCNFPKMGPGALGTEVTAACRSILGTDPDAMMCAASRMAVRRRGASASMDAACTLLPYDPPCEFEARLAEALGDVTLNHVHRARFCVLGGGSCSA